MCGCGKPAMCGCILALALLASPCGCQFLSVSSSSVSWVQGEDGQMHQETHSTQRQTSFELGNDGQLHQVVHEVHSDNGMLQGSMVQRSHSEIVCIDGMCKERDSITLTSGGGQQQLRGSGCGGGRGGVILLLPGSGPEKNYARQVEAPPTFVPRPGPAEIDINANAARLGVVLAVAAILASILTTMRVLCTASSRTVEAREVSLTRGPLAEPLALSQDIPMSVLPPAAVKATVVEEDCGCGKAKEAAFQFRPSVGTWLSTRIA